MNPRGEGTLEAISHIWQPADKYRDRDWLSLMLGDLNWMDLCVSAEPVLDPKPGLWVVPA